MKFLVAFIFTLLSFSNLHAQSSEYTFFDNDKQFYGAAVIGLNASQVDGDGFSGYHRAGLVAGGKVLWLFSKPLGMSLEFLYSQKGSRYVMETHNQYAGSYFAGYKMKLNYVEVPVLFQYFYSSRIIVGFGASYNALLSSSEEHSYMGWPAIDEGIATFNNYTVDLIGSISYMLWEGIMVSARYQYGITPLRDFEHVPNGFGMGNQHNNMFSFRLSYLF